MTDPSLTAEALREKIRNHVCNIDCGLKPVKMFYCPTLCRWVDCPGPCPDGLPHLGPETREEFTHVLR